MATIRRIFSYDDVEDKVIHDFLESIPQRQRSKHIRMAIRLYINETQGKGYSTSNNPTQQIQPEINNERNNMMKNRDINKSVNEQDNDNLVSLDDDFLDNLGK